MEKESETVRVLVVDDHPAFRKALASALRLVGDIEVAGEASGGEDACIGAKELQPDVVLMDLSMPVLNGLDATRLLREDMPGTPVVVFSAFDGDELKRHALAAGAVACLAIVPGQAEFLGVIGLAVGVAVVARRAGLDQARSQALLDAAAALPAVISVALLARPLLNYWVTRAGRPTTTPAYTHVGESTGLESAGGNAIVASPSARSSKRSRCSGIGISQADFFPNQRYRLRASRR